MFSLHILIHQLTPIRHLQVSVQLTCHLLNWTVNILHSNEIPTYKNWNTCRLSYIYIYIYIYIYRHIDIGAPSLQLLQQLHTPQCHDHYSVVIMDTMASQITSFTIVYSTLYSGADQRKHQSSASLAFVKGIHQWLPSTKGRWRGKSFHLMTSSCTYHYFRSLTCKIRQSEWRH